MLDFFFSDSVSRRKVHAVLTNRMNRRCMDSLRGNDRGPERAAFSRVAIVVPPTKRGWDFQAAFPVVSRDISPDGLSLIHAAEFPFRHVLIGLEENDSVNFVECRVQHCSDIGYGFHQIGLYAVKVVSVDFEDCLVLQQRMKSFQPDGEELVAG